MKLFWPANDSSNPGNIYEATHDEDEDDDDGDRGWHMQSKRLFCVWENEMESESGRGIKLPSVLLFFFLVLAYYASLSKSNYSPRLASTRRNETETQPQNFNRSKRRTKVQKGGKGSNMKACAWAKN